MIEFLKKINASFRCYLQLISKTISKEKCEIVKENKKRMLKYKQWFFSHALCLWVILFSSCISV